MRNNFCYNTFQYLWENYRASNPKVKLVIKDGHIWSPKDGTIGRFYDTDNAFETLKAAGYTDDLIEIRPDSD